MYQLSEIFHVIHVKVKSQASREGVDLANCLSLTAALNPSHEQGACLDALYSHISVFDKQRKFMRILELWPGHYKANTCVDLMRLDCDEAFTTE